MNHWRHPTGLARGQVPQKPAAIRRVYIARGRRGEQTMGETIDKTKGKIKQAVGALTGDE